LTALKGSKKVDSRTSVLASESESELNECASFPAWFASGRRGTVIAMAAGVLAVVYAVAAASRRQIDFEVYRMGGVHALSGRLYSVRLEAARIGGPLSDQVILSLA
jgi:hypothetical protein